MLKPIKAYSISTDSHIHNTHTATSSHSRSLSQIKLTNKTHKKSKRHPHHIQHFNDHQHPQYHPQISHSTANSPQSPIKLQPTLTSPLPSPEPMSPISPNMTPTKKSSHRHHLSTFTAVTGNLSVSLPSSPINRDQQQRHTPESHGDHRHHLLTASVHKNKRFNTEILPKLHRHSSLNNLHDNVHCKDVENKPTSNAENIRVMVRFRPFNKTENKYTERYLNAPFKSPGARRLTSFSHHIDFSEHNSKIKMNYFCGSKKAKEIGKNYRSYSFRFDKIFRQHTTQKDIFECIAKPICDDILQFKSNNATIFCYGQSGSGKTYSMFGPTKTIQRKVVKKGKHRRCTSERFMLGSEKMDGSMSKDKQNEIESMGIIGSSCCYIFDELKDLKESLYNVYSEFTYNIYIECIEIYNEKLKDLLNSKQVPVIREIETKRHSKIIDKDGNTRKGPKIFKTEIQNITRKHVKSIKEILNILQISTLNRNVSKTSLNESSSRSHMIIRLIIKTVNHDNHKRTESIINFVDLAGSENVKKTSSKSNGKSTKNGNNATPKTRKKQVKEAGNILKSLTALSQVIDALIKNKKHIPYKDSKLTRLLQNSLGGNCKTTLLICASPHIYNRYETIRSLKFGLRCQHIQNYICLEQHDTESHSVQKHHNKHNKAEESRKSVNISKPPLVLNDSKSLTLTINDGKVPFKDTNSNSLLMIKDDESVKVEKKHQEQNKHKQQPTMIVKDEKVIKLPTMSDEKSLKLEDCKSDKSNTSLQQQEPDNEELLKQIEQLNIENDLLRARDDLSREISTLNETISRIVLQNAFRKNRHKKKKNKKNVMDDAKMSQKIEDEVNIFQSKLIQLTIGLNAKVAKIQEIVDDGLSLCHKNDPLLLKAQSTAPSHCSDSDDDDDEEDEEDDNNDNDNDDNEGDEDEDDAEILILENADSTTTNKAAMAPSRRESEITMNGEEVHDDGNRQQQMIKHTPNANNLFNSINYNQKIYSQTVVTSLRRQNEELAHEVNKLKLEKQNSWKLPTNPTVITPKTPELVQAPYSHEFTPTKDHEEDDDYYICDDSDVYQNVYKKPNLKINCNAKKMDAKTPKNTVNTENNSNIITPSSNDITPRNSGKHRVPLNLLRENQTLSEQLNIMQKLRSLERDNRSTPRDSITLLNAQLIQQSKSNNAVRFSSSNSSSSNMTSTIFTNINPSNSEPSSARSSVNSSSRLSTTVESIDEHLEKWNNPKSATNTLDLFNKRRSSGKIPRLSICSNNTNNAPLTPQAELSTPGDTHDVDSLDRTPNSPAATSVNLEHTPNALEQSATQTLTFNDIHFAEDDDKEKQMILSSNKMDDDLDEFIEDELRDKKLPNNAISKLLDDPILKEETEDDGVNDDDDEDDDNFSDGQYEYSTDDDNTYYSNNFSSTDVYNPNAKGFHGGGINKFFRTRTDSQIFRETGLELSKKLKAKSVESPCQNNQRLSSTFAIHWINLKKI